MVSFSSNTSLIHKSVFCLASNIYNKLPKRYKKLNTSDFKNKLENYFLTNFITMSVITKMTVSTLDSMDFFMLRFVLVVEYVVLLNVCSNNFVL